MINLRYAAENVKLKALNLIISSKEHPDAILPDGERVDGSNMFSFIDAGSSDLVCNPPLTHRVCKPLR